MVKIMENPIRMDDLGGPPLFFGNIHIFPASNYGYFFGGVSMMLKFQVAEKPVLEKKQSLQSISLLGYRSF